MALSGTVQAHVDSIIAKVTAEFANRSDTEYFLADRPGRKLLYELQNAVARAAATETFTDLA